MKESKEQATTPQKQRTLLGATLKAAFVGANTLAAIGAFQNDTLKYATYRGDFNQIAQEIIFRQADNWERIFESTSYTRERDYDDALDAVITRAMGNFFDVDRHSKLESFPVYLANFITATVGSIATYPGSVIGGTAGALYNTAEIHFTPE